MLKILILGLTALLLCCFYVMHTIKKFHKSRVGYQEDTTNMRAPFKSAED